MRKILLSLIMVIAPVLAFAWNQPSITNYNEAPYTMVTVRNCTWETQTEGCVVIWVSTGTATYPVMHDSGTTYWGVDIGTSTSANSKYVAGVLAGDITSGNFGQMYVKGYCPKIRVSVVSAGDGLAVGSVSGAGDTSTTAGAIFAIAFGAHTSTGNVKGWLK